MLSCNDVTAWLLEADEEDIAVALEVRAVDHLRACGRCRSRTERVLHDTRSLAHVVQIEHAARSRAVTLRGGSDGRVKHAARAGTGLIGTLAAAALFWTITQRADPDMAGERRSVANAPIAPAGANVTPAAAAPLARVASSEAMDSLAVAAAPAVRPRRLPDPEPTGVRQRTAGQSFPQIAPVSPVRLDAPARVPPSASADSIAARIEIEPDSARRFAVLRASPRVTVVWFY